VFVLLWKGSLERASDPNDAMRIEILTALRRPQCFVVPLVFFTDRIERGGVLPEWLHALVLRRRADEEELGDDDADSLHIYEGLLNQQCVFVQKQHIARSLHQFFVGLPQKLGVDRHAAAAECNTLDELGVTVGMRRKQLEACFSSYVQSNQVLNHRVRSAIAELQLQRRQLDQSLHPSRLSVLCWNIFGGASGSSPDPIEHVMSVLRTFPSDVLALQEAPWGIVVQLAELGYTLQEAETVYTEAWVEDGKRKGKRPEYDVRDKKNRAENFNVLAVRLPPSLSLASSSAAAAAHSAEAAHLSASSSSAPSGHCPASSSPYIPLASLSASFPLSSAIELSCPDSCQREEDGHTVLVSERRVLQLLELRVTAPSAASAMDVDSAAASPLRASMPLCMWNTHLEVTDEPTRWDSAQRILHQLDFHALKQTHAEAAHVVRDV
jgi:hypothetical protein